jgi:hypothetical protein
MQSAETGQSKSPAGFVLPEHSTWLLLRRANDLRFGARSPGQVLHMIKPSEQLRDQFA